MNAKQFFLADEKSTETCGEAVARACEHHAIIYLHGDLGAGKTTFCRGFLRGLGYDGKVKSPTFTIIESYSLQHTTVYHFDLYRINDVIELELMGFRDYFSKDALILIEWPGKAEGILPQPDLDCNIVPAPNGRQINLQAWTQTGNNILAALTWHDDFSK